MMTWSWLKVVWSLATRVFTSSPLTADDLQRDLEDFADDGKGGAEVMPSMAISVEPAAMQPQQAQQPQPPMAMMAPPPPPASGGLFGSVRRMFSRSSAAKAESAPAARSRAQAPKLAMKAKGRKFKAKADTNVVAIKFASLAQDSDDVFAGAPSRRCRLWRNDVYMWCAGDPVFCADCKVVFTNTSKLLTVRLCPCFGRWLNRSVQKAEADAAADEKAVPEEASGPAAPMEVEIKDEAADDGVQVRPCNICLACCLIRRVDLAL